MDSSCLRRPCFVENDGLASIAADVEAGNHQHPFFSRSICYAKRGSFRNLSSLVSSSPRSGRFCDGRYEDNQPHFLESCFLCKKPLADNRDIFMYRGDTPFCSEECRQEQIDMDEAKERKWNLSSSMKALRKKEQKRSTSASPSKAKDYSSRAGTVAAA